MFWGKGDSSKLDPDQLQTLDDLRRLVETGHVIALTPEQSAVAVQAINFYASVQSASLLLVAARNILLFIGALIGMWWVSHDAVTSFIQAAASKGPVP
jgi:hypothetical protein